jgi:SAM-dependent methyltransferase
MHSPYDPALYDFTTPSTFRGDVEWYRRKARESGGPVLELGAGTGRVSLVIASDGIVVHALDADRGMLEALRRKVGAAPGKIRTHVVTVESDMRTFEIHERFALVIAPFRALLHNLTEEDFLACFRRVHEHLRPGGRFAFNVFHPSLEYMAQNAGALAGVWRWTDTTATAEGGRIVRSEANRYDTVRRRVHSQHRYEQYAADGTLQRTFLHALELSYLYPADITRLLQAAGFESIQIAGGFDGRAFSNDADELVVEATRRP